MTKSGVTYLHKNYVNRNLAFNELLKQGYNLFGFILRDPKPKTHKYINFFQEGFRMETLHQRGVHPRAHLPA